MGFSEFMAWLATNYWIGIGVATGIVVISYLIVSVLICVGARKRGVDVATGAMIPLWHLKYIFSGKEPKPKKVKNPAKTGNSLE